MRVSLNVTVVPGPEEWPRYNRDSVVTMVLEPHSRLTVDMELDNRCYRFALADLEEAVRRVKVTP